MSVTVYAAVETPATIAITDCQAVCRNFLAGNMNSTTWKLLYAPHTMKKRSGIEEAKLLFYADPVEREVGANRGHLQRFALLHRADSHCLRFLVPRNIIVNKHGIKASCGVRQSTRTFSSHLDRRYYIVVRYYG